MIEATKPNPLDRFRITCDCGYELKADRRDLNSSLEGICPHCNRTMLFTFWYKHTINRGAEHGSMVF